uniref:Pentatricopeptide repeat-containing protein n=1 Tax=Cucumis melo TaxID=3656 RepID=A0A9I9DLC0_CUCME
MNRISKTLLQFRNHFPSSFRTINGRLSSVSPSILPLLYYPPKFSVSIPSFSGSITFLVRFNSQFVRSGSYCTLTEVEGEESSETNADKLHKAIVDNSYAHHDMDGALDQVGVYLTTDLVAEILHRLRFDEKLAFRFFTWAARQENYSHEPRVYNEMIDILSSTRYKVKQFRIVCDLLDYMKRNDKNTVPVEVLFGILRNYTDKYLTSLQKFAKKKKIRVKRQPEINAFNLLLDALCKCSLVEDAEALLRRVKKTLKPDANTYNIMFFEMGKKGYPPDIVTYNCFLKVLCDNKMSDDALRHCDRMIEVGCLPSVQTYNMLVSMFFEMNDHNGAFQVWYEMDRNGCTRDVDSYCIMIEGLFGCNKVGDACLLLEEVVNKGMKLPFRKFDSFLMQLSVNGNLKAIHRLSEHMRKFYNRAMARRFSLNQKRMSMSLRGK